MKREYHHSEAWIAKHTEKAAARVAKIIEKKEAKKAAKEVKAAKRVAKKEAKGAKKTEKQVKVDKVKKVTKVDKKPTIDPAKEAKKAGKELMKNAKTLFGQTRKSSSAFKKTVKAYGKLVSEALKIGDTKTIEKIIKLFGRLGFKPFGDNCVIENVFTVKVKLPKAKLPKKAAKKESNDGNWVEQTINEIKITADQSTPAKPLLSEGPSDDELNAIEKEADELEVIENTNNNSESDSDNESIITETESDESEINDDDESEFPPLDRSRDREPLFDDNGIRESSDESFDEAMHENGDWDD